MILRLSPEQIVEYWEVIRPNILESLIPIVDRNEETVFRVLQSLLTESLQLWAGIEDREGKVEERVYAIMTTSISIDSISQTRSLLINSLFALKHVPLSDWEKGIRLLDEYKEKNRCTKLVAYTDIPEIVALASRLGFKTFTCLRKE
jgi:hypothetical protein